MATLSPESLGVPFEIDGTNINVQFTADATVGVKWSRFRHKEGTAFDYTPNLDDTTVHETFDGRLWNIECSYRDSNLNRVFVGPADAASFAAYTIDGLSDAILFEWKGVAVPGASDNDRLWVRVLCQLAASGDNDVKWYGWFGRESGWSVSVDNFTCPRLIFQAKSTPVGLETAEEASQRDLAFIPASGRIGLDGLPCTDLRTRLALSDSNYGTTGWIINSGSSNAENRYRVPWTRSVYPNVYWHVQFAAVCSGRKDVATDFLRTIYIQAEDGNYNYKSLDYRVSLDSSGDVWFMMSVNHVPTFHDDMSVGSIQDGYIPRNEWGNTYQPRYAVSTAAFTAKTADWYYDCCERYRNWFQSVVNPPIYKDSTDPTTGKDPTLIYATIQHRAGDNDWVNSMVGNVDALARSCRGTTFETTPRAIVHFQTYAESHNAVDGAIVDLPLVSGDYTPNLREVITELSRLGYWVTIYVRPKDLTIASGWASRAPIGLRRMVQRVGAPETPVLIEFPHNIEPIAIYDEIIRKVYGETGCTGVYLDFFGGFDNLQYNTANDGRTVRFLEHGGNEQIQGKPAVFDHIRSDMRSRFPGCPISTETVQEGLWGLDWVGIGYNSFPMMMMLADDTIDTSALGFGRLAFDAAQYPPEVRPMTPPFWNACHHEWQPGGAFGMYTHNTVLGTNTRLHPGGAGGVTDQGMTADQFREFGPFHTCMLWVSGHNCLVSSHSFYHDDPIAIGENQVDPATDSAGAGLSVLSLWRKLYESSREAYAGQFVTFGRMRRPLQTDHTSANIDLKLNPASYSKYVKDWGKATALPPWAAGTEKAATPNFGYFLPGETILPSSLRWSYSEYDAPNVVHCMWSNQSGRVAGVFVNWSLDAAAWRGTFDPTLYGIGGNYDVVRINLDGTSTVISAGESGTIVVGWGGGVGKDVDLGATADFPARSVDVIAFDPA